jgi:hypothetical protein
MRIRANIKHLIGRLNQPPAGGFLPLRAFKPSSSDSADRGRSIIQVKTNRKMLHSMLTLTYNQINSLNEKKKVV